jgi:lipid II:glycine glycyltransferase (peptidoglycan interpeptide bridge formation enzyme)
MPLVSFTEWQNFLKSNYPNAHVLQTAEWGELKSAFDWQPARIISGDTGAQILFRKLPLGFTFAYLPKPVFGGQFPAVSNPFWAEVDSVCHRKRAIFLKIEPDDWEEPAGKSSGVPGKPQGSFRLSSHNIQPPRTVLVSLDGSEDQILARMKQKCRYNVRLAEKKGVTVRLWRDLEGFHHLMQLTGSRDGFSVHSLAYYRKAYDLFHPGGMAELLVAEFEDEPLAALMIFAHGRRSWYLYGASNDEERNRMPTYLLQWEAIKWALQRGCTQYDLWGVPDADETALEAQFEGRSDGLWGVYRFKRGFGGQVKRAAQAIDKVYMPFLYRLYRWRMERTL